MATSSVVNSLPVFTLSPTVDVLCSTAADPTTLRKILNNCRPEGGCMIWKGGVSSQGQYPYLGKSRWAHREALRSYNGYLEEGSLAHESHSVEVHHTCRHKRCCNPLHLKEVTRRRHSQLHKGVN
jgi:hypothetical protein